MPRRFLVLLFLLATATANATDVKITPQDSGVKVRLRGISAVTPDIAWASGREGTVLHTTDGGKHWQAIKVPDAQDLDFRDVEGFDANTAVVLSIGPGEASRIYRTPTPARPGNARYRTTTRAPSSTAWCLTVTTAGCWVIR